MRHRPRPPGDDPATRVDRYPHDMPSVGRLEELQRAIDDVDVDELTLEAEPSALEGARRSLDHSGLLMLGEVHGVRENPLMIRAVMNALGVTGLGLEWHEELSSVVGSFASGGPLRDHPWLWSGDGRITAGHLALLRTLAAGGHPQPVLFDGTVDVGAGWSERDRLMAERILGADADGPRLVVAGNLHTRVRRTREGVPMGSRLQRERPGVREVRILYRRGRYYNQAPREFSSRRGLPKPPRHGGAVLREWRGQLLLDLAEATEAVVPQRSLPRRPRHPADRSLLVGLVRLDQLPAGADPAPHVDPERVAAMVPVFDSLPPITVFETPEGLLVADGYHRMAAARRLEREWITIELRTGTKHDALAFAVENARRERGLPEDQARGAIERWRRPE
jgi:hypothetical protein